MPNKKNLRRRRGLSGPTNRGAAPKRWFTVENLAEKGVAEIKLRGYIGAPKTYRDWWSGEEVEDPEAAGTLNEFEAELEALGDVSEIQLSIFSQGGDAFTGLAIHNLLVRHPAHKVCVIDGLCASAATHPAMACDEIRCPENAFLLIHRASWGTWGTADDLRAAADSLAVLDDSLADLYAARAGSTRAEMLAIMAKDRWMSGAEAHEMGLVDTVIEPLSNLASRAGTLEPLNISSLDHAPAAALALFDMSGWSPSKSRISNEVSILNPMSTPTQPTPASAPAPAPNNEQPPSAPDPAPVPAPVNQEPPAPAPDPAPAPAPAPVNDIAAIVTAAVGAGLQPFEDRLTAIENRMTHGIDPQNLGGAAPAPNVIPPTGEGAPAAPPLNCEEAKPMKLIHEGFKNMQEKLRAARA